jgi:hypothetical protein
VVLSGFVPFLAFIVEHRVYQQMQQEWTIDPSGAYVEVAGSGSVTDDQVVADRSGADRTVDGVPTDGG